MDGNKTSLPNYLTGHGLGEDSGAHGILKFLLEEKRRMGDNPYLNLLIEGIRKGSLDPGLARESYEKYLEKEGLRPPPAPVPTPPDSDARTRFPCNDGSVTQHSAFIDPRKLDEAALQSSRNAPNPFFGRSTGFDEDTFGRMNTDIGETETAASSAEEEPPCGFNQVTAAGDQKPRSHSHLFEDFDIPEFASSPPGVASDMRPQPGHRHFAPPSFAQPYDNDVPIDSESLLLDYDATRAGGIGAYIPSAASGGPGTTDAHDYYQRTRMPGGGLVHDSLPSIPEHDFGDYDEPSGAASLAQEPTDFDDAPAYDDYEAISENSATTFLATDADAVVDEPDEELLVVADFEEEETVQHQFRTDPSVLAGEPSLPMITSFENPDPLRKGDARFGSFDDVHMPDGFERLEESTECEDNSLASATDEYSDVEDEDPFECEPTRLSPSPSDVDPELDERETLGEEDLGAPESVQSSIKHGFIADFRTQADPVHFQEATSAEDHASPFTALGSGLSAVSSHSALTAVTDSAADQETVESPRDEHPPEPAVFAEQLNINSFVIEQFFEDEASPFANEATEMEASEAGDAEIGTRSAGPPVGVTPPRPPSPSIEVPSHSSQLNVDSISHFGQSDVPLGNVNPNANSAAPSLTPPPMSRSMPPRAVPQAPRIPSSPPRLHRPMPVGPIGTPPEHGFGASASSKTPPPPPSEHSHSGADRIPPPRSRGGEPPAQRMRSVPPPPPPNYGSGAPGLGTPPASAPPSESPDDLGGGPFRSEECIPQFIVPFTEISQRGVTIDHRMAYALSQIDGYCCIRDICDIVGIPVEDMVEALNELARKNIVRKK